MMYQAHFAHRNKYNYCETLRKATAMCPLPMQRSQQLQQQQQQQQDHEQTKHNNIDDTSCHISTTIDLHCKVVTRTHSFDSSANGSIVKEETKNDSCSFNNSNESLSDCYDYTSDEDDDDDDNDSFAATCNFDDSVDDMNISVGKDPASLLSLPTMTNMNRNARPLQSYDNILSTYISDDDDEVANDTSSSACSSFDLDEYSSSNALDTLDCGEHDADDMTSVLGRSSRHNNNMKTTSNHNNICSFHRFVRFGTVTIRTYIPINNKRNNDCDFLYSNNNIIVENNEENKPMNNNDINNIDNNNNDEDITLDIIGYEAIRQYQKTCHKNRKFAKEYRRLYKQIKNHNSSNNNNNRTTTTNTNSNSSNTRRCSTSTTNKKNMNIKTSTTPASPYY